MSSVLLEQVPFSCQEADIHRALLMYGTAVDIQIHRRVAQVVVTMRTPQEAQNLLNRQQVSILGTSVRVIPVIPPVSSSLPPHVACAPQALPRQALCYGGEYSTPPSTLHSSYAPPPSSGLDPCDDAARQAPTNRLRVVVDDCRFPITQAVLTQMFSMIAVPAHVYCGAGGPRTTGAVEFHEVASAERAMRELNNRAIYPDCCFVRLSYEPCYSGGGEPQGYWGGGPLPYDSGYGGGGHPAADSFSPVPPFSPSALERAEGGFASMPVGMRGGRGGRGRGLCTVQPPYAAFSPYADPRLESRPPPLSCRDATVMISNVPETAPLYDLWVLLEVYGNVNSLKRRFKEKTKVMAQFQNAIDAKSAVFYLQGCPFRGGLLGLKHFAGYMERGHWVEWNTGPASDPFTQAVLFSAGYHHRTKPSAPFNPLGRIRPDRNLFVSNLLEAITDEDLRELFASTGCELVGYYRKNASVVIAALHDTESAVNALIALHAKQMKDRYLRVTFSRYAPGPRPETSLEEPEEGGEQAQLRTATTDPPTGFPELSTAHTEPLSTALPEENASGGETIV